MKIGIDGNSLTKDFQHGTRRYLEELLKYLALLDKENKYYIFASKKVTIPKQNNFKLKLIPSFPILKRQLFLPIMVNKEKIDVFHNIDPYGPIFLCKAKIVTTVHDLNLDTIYPTFRNIRYLTKYLYSKIVRHNVFKNSDKFITVSKSTMHELSGYVDRNRLKGNSRVVYEAPSDIFSTLKKNKQKERYFLCIGDFSPRKNIEIVFKAFSVLPSSLNEYKLSIIVSTKEEAIRFKSFANKYSLSKRTKIYTSPPDTKVVKLYRFATAFLYTSLYEGFGLPILEAMACGCPVITSNYGAMKEIAGEAAVLVNPRSTQMISGAMYKIMKGRAVTQKALIENGYKRTEKFSWKETAKLTINTYKSVYNVKRI